MRIDFYLHNGDDVIRRLDRIEGLVRSVLQREAIMSAELDALTAEVAHVSEVEASAVLLLQGLKAQLDAAIASGDPAQLTALSASLETGTAALAAAITANTPAAP